MTADFQLSDFKRDALQELGNMSASHAANSLSELLGGKVEITAPNLNVVSMRRLPDVLQDSSNEVIPVFNRFGGGISGTVLMLYPMKYTPEGVKKMSEVMMGSLVNAIKDFFGVEIHASASVLPAMPPKSITGYLISNLGQRAGKAVFFNTNFIFSKAVVCHFFLSLNYEDVSTIMKAQVPEFVSEYGSFADMLETFEKLKNIEVKLYQKMQSTHVDPGDVRAMLRSFDGSGVSESKPLRKTMEILETCGIGHGITVKRTAPLEYVFSVRECTICRVAPPVTQGGSCYTTSTALGRIFSELFRVGCEVKEVECVKNGGSTCSHRVSLEQLDVFSILPVDKDLELLNALSKGPACSTALPGGAEESALALGQFGILENASDELKITALGRIFLTFAKNNPRRREDKASREKAPWES